MFFREKSLYFVKEIISKIVVFGLSFLMFAVAAIQILLGFALGGRTGHQKRIYMTDEPTKFWTIVAIPVVLGVVVFVWGLLLVFWKGEKK